MEKILRSLIQEIIPFGLRVELDLLSRRRDIHNKEKHQELILLLRKYGIDDIVQLGPGTNRYTIRLKGYVVKFATDADGKIDNAKEFAMAKLLQPGVIRVHEISSNYTILVCEYIQVFGSYLEMKQYEDKIRKILKNWSSVFLIGDVGIAEKNYSNWGIRIGTEEPVCLDFAYVYRVSSKLFTCDKCGTGILTPNDDFTYLFCNNPHCGKKYDFSDIRLKIGNDLHDHEIGELTDRGYLLTHSHTNTVLDEARSSYLKRNKKEVVEKVEEEKVEDEPDTFVMPYPL